VTAVCHYVSADVQAFLPDEFQRMFEAATAERLSEAMCVLYVALTRARHALHMLVEAKGAVSPTPGKTFAGLLRGALCESRPLGADGAAYEYGDPTWARGLAAPTTAAARPAAETLSIKFADSSGGRRRGWRGVSPSQLEGNQERRMADVLRADRAAGQQFGTLMHAWLAEIDWLDNAKNDQGLPSKNRLSQIAVQLGRPPESIHVEVKQFRDYLARPALKSVLTENSYRAEFANQFLHVRASELSLQVINERRFAQRAADQLMTGSIDRLVLFHEKGRVVAADVIDFKTDVWGDDPDQLAKKIEYYRPQLAAYRRAVAQNYRLDEASVSARLVFLASGEVVAV
jgi:ATP-dependent exoDNAse (exonuclease V) beta subunit